jgi:hypothetical protein
MLDKIAKALNVSVPAGSTLLKERSLILGYVASVTGTKDGMDKIANILNPLLSPPQPF